MKCIIYCVGLIVLFCTSISLASSDQKLYTFSGYGTNIYKSKAEACKLQDTVVGSGLQFSYYFPKNATLVLGSINGFIKQGEKLTYLVRTSYQLNSGFQSEQIIFSYNCKTKKVLQKSVNLNILSVFSNPVDGGLMNIIYDDGKKALIRGFYEGPSSYLIYDYRTKILDNLNLKKYDGWNILRNKIINILTKSKVKIDYTQLDDKDINNGGHFNQVTFGILNTVPNSDDLILSEISFDDFLGENKNIPNIYVTIDIKNQKIFIK